jgi:hypothetical protein
MAEEAVGLAKSLNWSVEWGPSYLNPKKDEEEAVNCVNLVPSEGRKLGIKRLSVEGEQLNNWDRVEVYGTGLKGYYWNGKMLIDAAESESDSDIEGDEWTNPELRESIAASSMVKVRKPSSNFFFGTGKVNLTIGPRNRLVHFTKIYHNTVYKHNPYAVSTTKHRIVMHK